MVHEVARSTVRHASSVVCVACTKSGFAQPHPLYTVWLHKCSKSMDQPGKVANSARGQLNRENEYLSVRVRA